MSTINRTLLRDVRANSVSFRGFPGPTRTFWRFAAGEAALLLLAYTGILLSTHFAATMLLFTIAYGTAAIFAISVGHQAFHGALLSSARRNKVLGTIAFLPLGLDGLLWRARHLRDHHPKPNTQGHDLDLDNPFFFRLAPYTQRRNYHRFQHLYAPIIYSAATAITVLVDDFRGLADESARHSRQDRFRLIFGFLTRKAAFVALWFVIPPLVNPTLTLSGALFSFMLASVPVGWLFLPIAAAHLNEHAVFFECTESSSFAERQSETTIDFCARSRFMTLVYGGLNCHLAHHLWPQVASCHYSRMYALLQESGGDQPLSLSLNELFRSHLRYLKRMGESLPD